jgi:hypothetical protein
VDAYPYSKPNRRPAGGRVDGGFFGIAAWERRYWTRSSLVRDLGGRSADLRVALHRNASTATALLVQWAGQADASDGGTAVASQAQDLRLLGLKLQVAQQALVAQLAEFANLLKRIVSLRRRRSRGRP